MTKRPWIKHILKIILQTPEPLSPFNEPARDLRIQNQPRWLNQRDLLAPYVTRELQLPPEYRGVYGYIEAKDE